QQSGLQIPNPLFRAKLQIQPECGAFEKETGLSPVRYGIEATGMTTLRLFALVAVILGIAVIIRAFQVSRRDFWRYVRGGAGVICLGLGPLLIFRIPQLGLAMILIGVLLIFMSLWI
ncbi:MAG TPA: hypothetical protein PKV43_14460, partial [Armatimonadota bacterium]|nr:hypothetical protein [Armatimonadota bacterium]